MKIIELLNKKHTISFEIFPPKSKDGDITSIYHTIDELAKLQPDFISVTYGAGGSNKGKTVEIASTIKNKYQIESVAHLSCVTHSKEDIYEICQSLKQENVENILALRGDFPIGEDPSLYAQRDFKYASDLTKYIQENFNDDFCISGACYPEVHLEANTFEEDLKALQQKVDAGADYLVTQIFFDNQYYYRLVKEARKIGINVPIIAGIMPITNAKQLKRTAQMCGTSIPYELSTYLEKYYHYPSAMQEIGINYATRQIIDLIANDADGIHIYTMNKPEIAKAVFESIPTVLKEWHYD